MPNCTRLSQKSVSQSVRVHLDYFPAYVSHRSKTIEDQCNSISLTGLEEPLPYEAPVGFELVATMSDGKDCEGSSLAASSTRTSGRLSPFAAVCRDEDLCISCCCGSGA